MEESSLGEYGAILAKLRFVVSVHRFGFGLVKRRIPGGNDLGLFLRVLIIARFDSAVTKMIIFFTRLKRAGVTLTPSMPSGRFVCRVS